MEQKEAREKPCLQPKGNGLLSMDTLTLLKKIRYARNVAEKHGKDAAIAAINDIENYVADPPKPKTIGEALQQFQQHQEEAHQAQKEFLEGLKNIQKNV